MICSLRNVLLLLAVAAAAEREGSAAPRAHQLDDSYTFRQYLSHFDKSYRDTDEYDRRSAIFAKNLDRILRHNEGRMDENGDVLEGYVMGVNKFTDVESRELPLGYNKAFHPAWSSQLAGAAVARTERLLGATDTITQSYSQPPDFATDEVSDLPETVDWEAEGKVNPTVPNQRGCGSCWTFAATAVVESHLAIATGEEPLTLSQQSMLECTPNPNHCGGDGNCSGSTPELGMNYIADISTKKKGGLYDIGDVPYDASRGDEGKCDQITNGKKASVGIEGWTQLPANDYKATMNAVAKVGPVAIAVAGGDWGSYEKGVFDTQDAEVNHAVLLAGYGVDEVTGEKYYKVRNSWGPEFGEDGYIRIKRTDDDDNVCQMDDNPLKGSACALDDNGNEIDVEPVKVCGASAVLFDVAYPVKPYNIND